MNKLCERARSERAWKLFPFSHSKTAISFNILLVLLILYLRNTYIFRSQNNYIFIYIQSMQFPVITYGMALYINDSLYRQNTNIEKIYVYASELRKFSSHFYILKLLFLSISFVGTSDTLSVQMTCLSAYM